MRTHEYFFNKAEKSRTRGEYQNATAAYDEAIKLNNGDARYFNGRGCCRYSLKMYRLASCDFEQALRLNRDAVHIKNLKLARTMLREERNSTFEDSSLTTEAVNKLFQDLERGDYNLSAKTPSAVLIAGLTGAGKSTFVDYLAGSSFRRDPQGAYVCDNPSMAIGHSATTSCTLKAGALQPLPGCDFSFVDLPGFLDVRHGENAMLMGLVTGVAMRKAATSFETIKGAILVVDYPSLTTGRAQLVTDSVLNLIQFLYGDVQRDQRFLRRLSNGELPIFMLVTKTEPHQLEQQRTTLMSIAGELSNAQDFASRCLSALIASQKYGFYHLLDEYSAGNDKVVTRDTIIECARSFNGIPKTDNNFLPVLPARVSKVLDCLLEETFKDISANIQYGEVGRISSLLNFLQHLQSMIRTKEDDLQHYYSMINNAIRELAFPGDPSNLSFAKNHLESVLPILRDLQGITELSLGNCRDVLSTVLNSVTARLQDVQSILKMQRDLERMEQEIDSAKQKIDELNRSISTLRNQISREQTRHIGEISTLNDLVLTERSNLNRSNAEHQRQLADMRSAQEDSNRTIPRLESRIRALELEIRKLQGTADRYRHERNQADRHISRMSRMW